MIGLLQSSHNIREKRIGALGSNHRSACHLRDAVRRNDQFHSRYQALMVADLLRDAKPEPKQSVQVFNLSNTRNKHVVHSRRVGERQFMPRIISHGDPQLLNAETTMVAHDPGADGVNSLCLEAERARRANPQPAEAAAE